MKIINGDAVKSLQLLPPAGSKRNRRIVWTIVTRPYKGAHFATFPEELVRQCILAGSKPGGTILNPFCGSGTTGVVAMQKRWDFIGAENSKGGFVK